MISWAEKTVKVNELKPYEKNPRRISEQAFTKLKSSLKDLGYHQRIIATPDLRVIGGHQRIKALTELGIKQVQILVPDKELTDNDFKRLLIQDNLSFGDFDLDMLASDFDVEDLLEWGMPEGLLAGITKGGIDGLTDPDDVPETPANPATKLGDVWVMGNHRIICGDSTSADVVAKLLGNVKPHLMVTDPPYGVEYDATWRDDRAGKTGSTGTAKGKVLNDDIADWREAWALFTGDVAYVWHAGLRARDVVESLEVCGFKMRAQIIWAKSQLAMSRGHYHFQHEPCWYAVREKATGHWNGDRKQSTLWQIDKPNKSETGHSTQKPVECMRRPMENNSSVGQAVYEPFSGSGTSIIAGEQIGRHVYAIELNPAYVDVAVKRWQDFSGKQATLESNGKTFNELSNGMG